MNADKKTIIILTPGFPADEADTDCLPFPQLFVQTLKILNPSLTVKVLAFHIPLINQIIHGMMQK